MPRARPSGIRLSRGDTVIVLGMIQRGDRKHDIAAWFGVNPGRIAEAEQGLLYTGVKPASQKALPPPVSPGPIARTALDAIRRARRDLEKTDSIGEAKAILDQALEESHAGGQE